MGCLRGTHSNVEEGVGGEALRERMGVPVLNWSSHMHSSGMVNLGRENSVLNYHKLHKYRETSMHCSATFVKHG